MHPIASIKRGHEADLVEHYDSLSKVRRRLNWGLFVIVATLFVSVETTPLALSSSILVVVLVSAARLQVVRTQKSIYYDLDSARRFDSLPPYRSGTLVSVLVHGHGVGDRGLVAEVIEASGNSGIARIVSPTLTSGEHASFAGKSFDLRHGDEIGFQYYPGEDFRRPFVTGTINSVRVPRKGD